MPACLGLRGLAPEFSAETTLGPMPSFREHIEGKWTLLFSHPSDATPVCTSELGAAAKLHGEFRRRGVQLVMIAPRVSDEEAQKRFPGFRTIRVPSGKAYAHLIDWARR